MTFASSSYRITFPKNSFLIGMCLLFLCIWGWTFANTADMDNWLLENICVFLLVLTLAFTHRFYTLSDMSYLMVLLFLLLHLYGTHHVYAHNPLGEWIQAQTGSTRNPYDRIVHFSFGLLLAYPMREVCLNYIKCSPTLSWILPVLFSLALGALYEIIEWLLVMVVSPSQGTDFLGVQGDEWDAQKDMALEFAGSFCGVSIISIFKKIAS